VNDFLTSSKKNNTQQSSKGSSFNWKEVEDLKSLALDNSAKQYQNEYPSAGDLLPIYKIF